MGKCGANDEQLESAAESSVASSGGSVEVVDCDSRCMLRVNSDNSELLAAETRRLDSGFVNLLRQRPE